MKKCASVAPKDQRSVAGALYVLGPKMSSGARNGLIVNHR